MRPLPEPMDGTGAGWSRSTEDDVTAYIPRLDDDEIGRIERDRAARDDDHGWPAPPYAAEQGWYERLRGDVAAADADKPGGPMWSAQDGQRPLLAAAPPLDVERVARHRAAQSDLPGPSRRELARLIRQVRALVLLLVVMLLLLPLWVPVWYRLVGWVS
jgi:hypothetical protein